MTEREQILKKQFETLPEKIRHLILNSGWENTVRELVQKYKLHVDTGSDIEELVLFTMIGLEAPDDFIQDLEDEVGLPRAIAREIGHEINNLIFKEIREDLVEISKQDLGHLAEYVEPQPQSQSQPTSTSVAPTTPTTHDDSEDVYEEIDHETLLNEIENPKKGPQSMRSGAVLPSQPPRPAQRPTPAYQPPQPVTSIPVQSAPTVAHSTPQQHIVQEQPAPIQNQQSTQNQFEEQQDVPTPTPSSYGRMKQVPAYDFEAPRIEKIEIETEHEPMIINGVSKPEPEVVPAPQQHVVQEQPTPIQNQAPAQTPPEPKPSYPQSYHAVGDPYREPIE